MTNIEWTDETWNPIVGCSIVSPGCTNCYAMTMARRIEKMSDGAGRPSHYAGTTRQVNDNTVWTGKLARAPQKKLEQPLRWTKPRMIFVNSMGDLFHEDVPDSWIDRVFAIMALCPQHTFQILTKRADRMRDYMSVGGTCIRIGIREEIEKMGFPDIGCVRKALPNVWLGVSVEDQARADERIPLLLDTPAAIRFLSCEPLLGAVDLTNIKSCGNIGLGSGNSQLNALNGENWVPGAGSESSKTHKTNRIDWVIVGGESGPKARPMHQKQHPSGLECELAQTEGLLFVYLP